MLSTNIIRRGPLNLGGISKYLCIRLSYYSCENLPNHISKYKTCFSTAMWFIWHNLNSFEKVPDITFYRLKLSALISSSRKIAFPPNLISSYYNFHGMYQIRITNPSWWTTICVCHLPLQWNCLYFPTSETHLSLYPGPVCLVL